MKKVSIFLCLTLIFVFPLMLRADSIILSPSDFHPSNGDVKFIKYIESMHLDAGSPGSMFSAAVHLPDGARITSVVVFYDDGDATRDLEITFYKTNVYTNNFFEIAEWATSGTSGGFTNHKIAPVSYGLVDNNGYAYSVTLIFDSGSTSTLRLHKVKINYM